MIITLLLIGLIISFAIHLRYLMRYVIEKEKKYLRGYLNTTITNVLLALSISITAMLKPSLIYEINFTYMLWIVSGVILVIMLTIKISIFRKIYQRAQLPENYHLNFFGKKVLHPTVVKPHEVLTFFFTIPIFLLIGAYFVARLINLILYHHI
ncbi:MAG TPA: hypothetical protein PK341_07425 [Spirochaetota bacterium]|nr:hypothetical protein [Spirochaetota bacterium]